MTQVEDKVFIQMGCLERTTELICGAAVAFIRRAGVTSYWPPSDEREMWRPACALCIPWDDPDLQVAFLDPHPELRI